VLAGGDLLFNHSSLKHSHARNPRKVTNVMGCALSRQSNFPGVGLAMSAMV
jgi:hypothetical protein